MPLSATSQVVVGQILAKIDFPLWDFAPRNFLSFFYRQGQGENVLHYAALSLKKTNERHHQQETDESACVYSRVKSRKQWTLPFLSTQEEI